MSVWKKIESKILEANVDRDMLTEALESLEIRLDYNTKTIKNSYGTDSVDAAFIYGGQVRSLGFNFNQKGGVELVGDIYGTGLGRDGKQDTLMNKIAQAYQKINVKNVLDQNGWTIENETTTNGKIEIEVYQF